MTLELYDGREVTGVAIALTGAGEGLTKAMRIAPQSFHVGERVTIVMEAVVKAVTHKPAITDDLGGPLTFVAAMKAEAAVMTTDPEVAKLLDKHKAALNSASEIEGQQSIMDDMPFEILEEL